MELVYLWVDSYKNIRNQGFNFSPRFECEFKDGVLTICDKKKKECKNNEYLENFFGKNINITAIVGENGSGKTSLIDFIYTSINVKDKKKFLFLFSDNNQKYYTSNLNLSKINLTVLEKFNFNRCNYTIPKGIIINSKSYDMNNTLRFFISIFKKVEKNLFFNPNSILIKENQEKKREIISELLEDIKEKKQLEEELSKINIYILDVMNKSFNNEKYIDFLCAEDNYDEEIPEFFDEKGQRRLKTRLKENKFYKDFLHYLLNLLIALKNNPLQKPINPFINYIQNEAVIYLFRNIQKVNSIEDFLHELNENEFISPIDYDDEENELPKDKTFETNCSDYLDLERLFINKKIELSKIKIEKIEKFNELLYFDFFDDKDVSFNDFSEGEKNLFLSNLEIYFQYSKGKKIILLDEIELSLHPQWQKQYINNLLKLFEFNNVHFIFVTHSPFLLSDIPKENVIFLEKYDEKNKKELENKYPKLDIKGLENANCINVSEHIELKTFGANIHTLLSNGFFMSDGLMGEFAKEKIKEILEYLNDTKNKVKLKTIKKEQIKPIIKSIGEDFLRKKLLNLYRNKFIKDEKEKEKQILKNKIEELQKQLRELNV